MMRGGFLSAKERTALQAVMRHPSEIHGVARRANAIYTRRRRPTTTVRDQEGRPAPDLAERDFHV